MFLKNINIIFKIKRSKVTDYAALKRNIENVFVSFSADCNCGFVCAERDRSSKVMSPCSSEGRPCRCQKGMLIY